MKTVFYLDDGKVIVSDPCKVDITFDDFRGHVLEILSNKNNEFVAFNNVFVSSKHLSAIEIIVEN